MWSIFVIPPVRLMCKCNVLGDCGLQFQWTLGSLQAEPHLMHYIYVRLDPT